MNEQNRRLIVGMSFFSILLWGPRDPISFYLFLTLIPVTLWLLLTYFKSKWNIDEDGNHRIWRGLVGIIAGVLFFNAYLLMTLDSHYECDYWAGRGESRECVGDYVEVGGPNRSSAFIAVSFGLIAAYLAIARHGDKD